MPSYCGLITGLPVLAVLVLGSPEPLPAQAAPHSVESELRKIEQMRNVFICGFNAADAERMASVLAADYIDLSNGRPIVVGRDAAKANYAAIFAQYTADGTTSRLSVQPEQTWIDGGLAVERGRFVVSMRPRKGEERRIERRYVEVWRRQTDGSWLIVCDMDNVDGQEP